MHALHIRLIELNNLHNTGLDKARGGPPCQRPLGALLSVCHCQAYHFSSLNNLPFLPCSFSFRTKLLLFKVIFLDPNASLPLFPFSYTLPHCG